MLTVAIKIKIDSHRSVGQSKSVSGDINYDWRAAARSLDKVRTIGHRQWISAANKRRRIGTALTRVVIVYCSRRTAAAYLVTRVTDVVNASAKVSVPMAG